MKALIKYTDLAGVKRTGAIWSAAPGADHLPGRFVKVRLRLGDYREVVDK